MAKMGIVTDKQFSRLHKSIKWSNRQLEYPKEKRIESVKQFIGFHHVRDGSERRVPVPFIKLAVNIYVRLLAPHAPTAMISAVEDHFKPVAAALELAVNEIPEEIQLQDTLRRLVCESLFSFGVAKCGLSSVGEVLGHSFGESFIDVVTIDDLVIDMTAKHISQLQYIGNDYWLDYEIVMEDDWFEKKGKKDLVSDEYTVLRQDGSATAQAMAIDENLEPLKDKVWLRDVWLPDDSVMVTYAINSKRILKEIEWSGPDGGPYHILGYDYVAGNLLPLPPVSSWRDLHDLANALWRKLGDQGDSEKTVLGFDGTDDAGAEAFAAAVDGDGIKYTGREPKTLKAGGINERTLAFSLQCRDLFSYFASNLDSVGGLSPQADTLGQDKLLSQASGAQLRSMADQVVQFTEGLYRSLAWYEWNDPVRKRHLEKKIPGTDFVIPIPWDREMRQGKFDVFKLKIDIYSLQDASPSSKLQRLQLLLKEFILPLMPAIERIGGSLDVQRVIEMAAKYAGFPEGKELVTFMEPSELSLGAGAKAAPQDVKKTYEHVSRPGASAGGKSQIIQQALLGGKPQGSEIASLGRPTG